MQKCLTLICTVFCGILFTGCQNTPPKQEIKQVVEKPIKMPRHFSKQHIDIFHALMQDGTQVVRENDDVHLFLPASGNFTPNSSTVNPFMMMNLDLIAKLMEQQPYTVASIHGHTDNTGTVKINQALSERRSHAVIAYMESQGIPGNRLFTVGHNENKPIASNTTEEGRQQNRRIEIIIHKQKHKS